jgi:hypothetical protein
MSPPEIVVAATMTCTVRARDDDVRTRSYPARFELSLILPTLVGREGELARLSGLVAGFMLAAVLY